MSIAESDLFVDQPRIPGVDDVAARIAAQGHSIVFPAGFQFTDPAHEFWLPVTLDGAATGFDYKLFARDDFISDDPEAAAVPQHGDSVLCFAARGDSRSVLAMALVQRAICEASDAQGWWQEGEEAMSNAAMIAFCTGTIDAAKATPAPVPVPPRAGPSLTNPQIPEGYFRNIGKALLGGAVVVGGAMLLIYLMGTYFGPGAGQ